MPIILAVLSALTTVGVFVWRAKNAADMTHELLDVANDVRLAARRMGFRRRNNQHPVESIDTPNLAMGTIATAFIELSGLPTQNQRDQLNLSMRKTLRLTSEEAEEIQILSHWLVTQCNGPDATISRVARRLYKLDGAHSWEPLLTILKSVTQDGASLSTTQTEALQDIQRAFRVT